MMTRHPAIASVTMLHLALIGDIHDHVARLEAALELLAGRPVDVVLQAGDAGLDPPWRSPARERDRQAHDDSVRRVLGRIGEALAAPVVFVPGNHDLPDAVEVPGAINVDGRVVDVAGLAVAGLGGAGPERFGFPYEWSEDEAERALETLPAGGVDVLLVHAPPLDTPLDWTVHGRHVGSRAVGRAIARLHPGMFVCGHIHEARGVARHAGTACINAGSLGEPFGQVVAWWVAWDGGPRTILSLGRGRGGDVVAESHALPEAEG